MISIDTERCSGCGVCLDACPTGALYLVDGKAVMDGTLCRACPATPAPCLAACPNRAIALASPKEPAPDRVRVPALRPAPEVVQVRPPAAPAAVPLRVRALPVLSAALVWVGREILPRLADVLLDSLDRRTARPQATGLVSSSRKNSASATGNGAAKSDAGQGGGRRYRHRRRGR